MPAADVAVNHISYNNQNMCVPYRRRRRSFFSHLQNCKNLINSNPQI